MEGEQDARLRRRSLAANAALRRLSGDSSSINNTSNISNSSNKLNILETIFDTQTSCVKGRKNKKVKKLSS